MSLLELVLLSVVAAQAPLHSDEAPANCDNCAVWNQAHAPFKIYGDSYYVGVDGLSSVLITTPKGHILIDGGLPQSAAVIASNIKSLGFDVHDVKWILNSHTHYDHVGGIAALQRMSGAKVVASTDSAKAMQQGQALPNDPQFGFGNDTKFPAIKSVKTIADGDSIVIGNAVLTAVFTPGHTAGGTTWTWPSCEAGKCLTLVFADSLTPVSAPDYKFSAHPQTVAIFRRSIDTMRNLKCDIIISAHPSFSDLFEKAASKSLVDAESCRKYADDAEARLKKRLADEASK